MIETSKLDRIDMLRVSRCDKTSVERRLRIAAQALVSEWKALARALTTTRADYRHAISYNVVGGTQPSVELSLRGMVPNIVEQGLGPGGVGTYGAFDLRTILLKGKPYVDVPFDYALSDIRQLAYYIKNKFDPASRASRLKPFSESGERFGSAPPTLRGGTRIGSWGPRLRSQPKFLSSPTDASLLMQEPHSTSVFAGLVKLTKQEQHAHSASEYRVFRRLSAKGKAWIHPGVKPRRLAKKLNVGRAISDAYKVKI